jgi:glycosyltransferase involved in cell wall biosynthesis
MRLVAVTTHPIQYQAPLFRRLARKLDLIVVFMMHQTPEGQARAGFGVRFDWDIPLLDGYSHIFALNGAKAPSSIRRDGIVLKGHEELLASSKPDALMVMGWSPRGYMQVIHWARQMHVALICRGEANLLSGRSCLKRLAKAFYFPRLFAKFKTFSVVGRANHSFYQRYGVPNSRLYFAPYSVDTAFFEREFANHRPRVRRSGPWRLGFAGKLIPKKRPHDMLIAIAKCQSRERVHAVFVGDGPLREDLEATARQSGVSAEFRGFLNQSQIVAKGYADFDALVLPSGEHETWGLVVNEAMTGGIPALVSDMVGCALDLIKCDVTGYVFRAGNIPDLARSIDRLIARLENNHDFTPPVLAHISNYSLDRTVAGIERAFEAAIR